MQAAKKLTAHRVLRQHATNRMFNETSRMFFHDFFWRYLALSTWITRISKYPAVVKLFAGHTHLFSVDNNHMVTHVGIWRVSSFIFAAQYTGYLAGQSAQHLVFC